MKLSDNMTMEACNVWGEVAPRKCRPPRIGDIPKHSAVDEESPGSSSKKLTLSPASATEPGLEIQLKSPKDAAFPREHPEAYQRTAKSEARKIPPLERDKPSRINSSGFPPSPRQEAQSFLNKPIESIFEKSALETFGKYELKESTDPAAVKNKSAANGRTAEDFAKIPSSPEDISDIEIQEVRKDSALFLEETEGLPALREILKSRAPKIVRPRRESSGYASSIGTFDEGDRRNSDVLQDLSAFLKERRRSSTKRPNSKIENFGTDIGSADRMPTTEVHRKISSAGLEMPNIEEVKEFLKDDVRQEDLDDLCTGVGNIDTLARCHLIKEQTNQKTSPEESQIPRDHPRNVEILPKSRAAVLTRHQDASDTSSLTDSIQRNSPQAPAKPKKTVRRMVHQSSTVISATSVDIDTIDETFTEILHNDVPEYSTEPQNDVPNLTSTQWSPDDPIEETQKNQTETITSREDPKSLSRTIRTYQLLSTQSEDRVEGEPHPTNRRISLQIADQEAEALETKRKNNSTESVSISRKDSMVSGIQDERATKEATLAGSPNRKLSSPGDVGTGQRFLGDVGNMTVRPIYPYCPYSPYGSPQGSPRNRRRPLRESRRVSIDNRQGALQLNQYKLLDNIGQGSYGIVKLAYNEEDETHYAMKILSKKKLMKKAGIFGRMAPGKKGAANPLAKVYREIALLKKLDHPNVVKLVEVLDDPDEDNLYLVFELVQRGEVLQIPTDKPLTEETARKNFRDVVLGVEYLHYQRIVHRDIKPSNLLVDSEGRIKIADLGVSAELRASGELLSGPAGTPAFAAPETTTPGAHYSGTPCDIWSMGVTLYSLVTGRVPWDGAGSIIGVQAAIRSEVLRFPEKPTLSENLQDMISRMLAKNPADRITLSEMKEHVWLTNRGADPLPSEADNCRLPVTVTDEEVERVVTRVPKLDTLILIKTMLKQHSFQNPFLPKRLGRTACNDTDSSNLELSTVGRSGELEQRETARNAKTERFHRAGRSNSAPDSYDWQINGRQISVDSPLPPVTEASSQESEVEKR